MQNRNKLKLLYIKMLQIGGTSLLKKHIPTV